LGPDSDERGKDLMAGVVLWWSRVSRLMVVTTH
jgi:hypothetical protein